MRFRDNPGTIANKSNLAIGQNLAFSGGNLELQGQLQAGGDLKLQATDTVQMRDSRDNPFIFAFGSKSEIVSRDVRSFEQQIN